MDALFREYTSREIADIEAATGSSSRLIFMKVVRTVFGPRALVLDYGTERVFVLTYTPDFALTRSIRLTGPGSFREVFLRHDDARAFHENLDDGDDRALADDEGALHVTFSDRANRLVKYLTVLADGSSGFSLEPWGSVLRRTSTGMVFLQRPGRGPARATVTR